MDAALKPAVMFYGVGTLKKLRGLPHEEVQRIADAAGELSEQYPLHLGGDKRFDIPGFGEKLTPVQVLTALVFGLWVLCNEDERLSGPLLETWPIREAKLLADNESGIRTRPTKRTSRRKAHKV